MSEQTQAVEEILGWTPVYYSGTPMIVGWHADGGDEDERKGATVDDLADWLHDQGWPTQRFDQGPTGVNMIVYDDDGRQATWWNLDEQMTSFPTILAALEAAVRAVHEQETSDG